jgi:hypothetical protein
MLERFQMLVDCGGAKGEFSWITGMPEFWKGGLGVLNVHMSLPLHRAYCSNCMRHPKA